MQTLNYQQAIPLNNVLLNKELKVKHIIGEQYVKLLYLKRKLRNEIDKLVEVEQEAAKEIGYDHSEMPKPGDPEEKIKAFKEKQKEYTEKLTAIQKGFKVNIYSPFLTLDEFKSYAEVLDFESASIIAEFLLKDFTEEKD